MGTNVPGTSVPDIPIRPRPISGAIYISDVVFFLMRKHLLAVIPVKEDYLAKFYTKNVYLNPKPPRNDHQVNQTQRSPIKGKTSDVKN